MLISLRYPNPVYTTATYASNTVADPGKGPEGGSPPAPPPPPPPISRSGSGTAIVAQSPLLQVKSRKITLCYFICNSLGRLLIPPPPRPIWYLMRDW